LESFHFVDASKNRRITHWTLTLVSLAIIAFAYFFGVQSVMWWKVWQFEKGNPVLWVIPQALPDSAPSRQSSLKLSAYGHEFEVPWRDIDKEKNIESSYRYRLGLLGWITHLESTNRRSIEGEYSCFSSRCRNYLKHEKNAQAEYLRARRKDSHLCRAHF